MSLRKHLLALGSVIAILGTLCGPAAAGAAPAPPDGRIAAPLFPDLVAVGALKITHCINPLPLHRPICWSYLNVTIKNAGRVRAGASTTEVTFPGWRWSGGTQSTYTSGLRAGESTVLQFDLPDGYDGGTVTVRVDKWNRVEEGGIYELNNVKTLYY